MTLLKHILLIVSLLAAAMPCCHAVGHGGPLLDAAAEAGIDASHACACHSCDEAVCSEEIEMPQEMVTASDFIEPPVVTLQLFIFSETRLLKRLASPAVVGVLASIQTVQLLI